jgi:hypothetical protein
VEDQMSDSSQTFQQCKLGVLEMENEINVVKQIECDSLSRMSKLTYEFGVSGEAEVVMRIVGNSGSGMFSNDWVSTREVLNILRVPLYQESVASVAFRPLYVGKSINTPSFLMAALRNEEVITPHPTNRRGYQVTAVSAFEERLAGLLGEGAQAVGPAKKASGKGANRKNQASSE